MGKRIKRIVAFLLVLCMLSAEIPFSSFAVAPSTESNATETESGKVASGSATSVSSMLSTSAKGTGAKIVYDFQKFHKYPQPVKDLGYADTHGFWSFGETNIGTRAFRINNGYGIECDSLSSTYVALKLYVPVAGNYTVNQAHGTYAGGGIADVYFMPGSITSVAEALQLSNAADYKIGSVDFYGSGSLGSVTLNNVNVPEAGSYYIVYKVAGSNPSATGTKSTMRIGTLTLSAGSNLAVMELTASVPKNTLKVEEQLQISASAYMSDGTNTGITFQYRSLNSRASVDGNGLVTALESGEAEIEVTALGAAGNKSTVVKLQVAQLNKAGYKITYNLINGFKYQHKVNTVTYANTHSFWAFDSVSSNFDSNNLDINTNYGIRNTQAIPNGGWVALKVQIPAPGDYKFSQIYGTLSQGSDSVEVFRVKKTANLDMAVALADESNYVGQFNCKSSSWTNVNGTANFGYVNFAEAGEYLFVYRIAGNGAYMYLGEITLDGGSKLAVMEMTASSAKTTMQEEDVSQITASAYLSNGKNTGMTFSYESLNSCATVSDTGLIKAVAAGEAEIKVTATCDGHSKSTVLQIPIGALSKSGTKITLSYKLDFKYQHKVNTITYADTDGFWEFGAVSSGFNSDNLDINGNYGIRNTQAIPNGGWVALKVQIPVKGDYKFTQVYGTLSQGSDAVEIFRVKNTSGLNVEEALLDSSNYVGKVNCKSSSWTNVNGTASFGYVNFPEAGEYLFVYRIAGNGAYMYLGDVTLSGGDKLAVMQMTASAPKNTAKAGEKLQISASSVMSDYSAGTQFKYESLNDKAKVNSNGVVTAVSAGTAKIKVTAVGSASKSEIIEIKISALKLSGVKVDYDMSAELKYQTPVKGIDYATTHGFWEYYGVSQGVDEDLIVVNGNYGFCTNGYVPVNGWVAVKINVPKAGDYLMTQQNGTLKSGAKANVYVVKATSGVDVEASMTTDNYIGFVDFTSDVYVNANREANFGYVSFAEAGEYLLVYKNVHARQGQFYIGDVSLYGGDEKAIMYMDVTTAKGSIKQGDAVQILAQTYISDGTVADVVYRYNSLNKTVVVSRTGIISAIATGTAKIDITAVYGDSTKTYRLEILVSGIDPAGTKLYYDFITGLAYGTQVREIQYKHTNDAWQYYADNAPQRPFTSHNSFGIWMQAVQNAWVAIKIKVPTAGDYLMSQKYSKMYVGSQVDVYLMPGNTPANKIEGLISKTPLVGSFDCYSPGSNHVVHETTLGVVSFPKAGEYILVYRTTKLSELEGARLFGIMIGEINLDGVNCLKRVVPNDEHVSLNYGKTYQSKFVLRRLDGTTLDPKKCTITYRSGDPAIAAVDANGKVTATGHGTTTIEITAYDGVESHTGSYTITAIDNTGVNKVYIDMDDGLYVRETALVPLVMVMKSGNKIRLDDLETSVSVSDSKVLKADIGVVTALEEGSATITASGSFLGKNYSAKKKVTVTLHKGKTDPTYYTYEMRNIAQENIVRYDWAQENRDKTVANARIALRSAEQLYDLTPFEGIPRSRQLGYNNDPNYGTCRNCGCNVQSIYGDSAGSGFLIDPVLHPWKVQCPDCLYYFPTNDFASFYELGLDEYGKFDYDKAWAENEKLKKSGHKGYLVNELYPEKGETWGVDDGFGARVYKDGSKYHKYIPADPNLDKPKSAVYIPLWLDNYWYHLRRAISNLANAYVYTGEIAYARAGAMLLDRVADVSPDYNMHENFAIADFLTSCGGTGYGTWAGRIEDPWFSGDFAKAADAFFPMLNDRVLISNLSKKAQEYKLKNDKSSSQKIWENWRNNLLIESLDMCKEGRIYGNYGLAQHALTTNAVVLAEEPESSKMLEWIYERNTATDARTQTGGDFTYKLMSTIDRDGMGDEAAPNYNSYWLNSLYRMADEMALYKGEKSYNPYEHPKFVQMFANYPKLVEGDLKTAYIGDTGDISSATFVNNKSVYVSAWKNLKSTPIARDIAQYLYLLTKGNLSSLSVYGIFEKNPESIENEIMALVDLHGEKESDLLPGYGFGILRSGFTNDTDSLRSVWMYYGSTFGHGHYDTLNISINAFGLDMTPDFGYPANTINDDHNTYFLRRTIAHNTVLVDESEMLVQYDARDPYVFDDSDYVKVIGVEAKDVYRQTQSYNRTMVMVKVDDDNSYYVDFFRVLGGEKHTYSFHARSHNAMPLDGLDMQMQMDDKGNLVGTYAGPDIEKGEKGDFPMGYNYLTKVRKDTDVDGNTFVVDFAITDYDNHISNNQNLHLKMTQINNFVPSEVAIVGGAVTNKKANNNILKETDTLEFVLTQRESKKGEKLDSLFTTVFEPYRQSAYIKSIEELDVKVVSGKPGKTDTAKAVAVTHKDGRVDYVFYATNNTVTYRVADVFDVRGYVGVYSVDGATGNEVYRYVANGDIIVEKVDVKPAYTGKIINYSTAIVREGNFIDVDLDASVVRDLPGRYIYIENDGVENAIYEILDAWEIDGGIRLDIGTVSLARDMRNELDERDGYIYNVAKGQRIAIPTAYVHTDLSQDAKLMHLDVSSLLTHPGFEPEEVDYTTFVGNSVKTVDIRAIAADPKATVKIQVGATRYDGSEALEVPVAVGENVIEITVIAEDGMTVKNYYVTVTRAPHFCYGGTAYCDKKAVCIECEGVYGDIDPNSHEVVELWNAVAPTKEADGYSGDYYCVKCHLLATRGEVLTWQSPVNVVLVLCIAAGVLLAGGTAAALIIRAKKKGAAAEPQEGETPEDSK